MSILHQSYRLPELSSSQFHVLNARTLWMRGSPCTLCSLLEPSAVHILVLTQIFGCPERYETPDVEPASWLTATVFFLSHPEKLSSVRPRDMYVFPYTQRVTRAPSRLLYLFSLMVLSLAGIEELEVRQLSTTGVLATMLNAILLTVQLHTISCTLDAASYNLGFCTSVNKSSPSAPIISRTTMRSLSQTSSV